MTITHLLTSSLATGILLGTTQPEVLLVGAIAGLLPDIDISTSPIGRILRPVSSFFEKRMAHRSATHSLIASLIVAVVTYGLTLKFLFNVNYIHALNIGFFAGWFLDCFTKSGVEMFYPLPVRCVCPGNRNLRISTASPQEYVLVSILTLITIGIFHINSNEGLIPYFNRIIGAPSGVMELYNEKGGSYIINAEVDGVYASDRSRVKSNFQIIDTSGNDFILLANDGSIHKAGSDPEASLITQRITGKTGKNVKVLVKTETFIDGDINNLIPYMNQQAYTTGTITVDDPEIIILSPKPREYQSINLSGNTVTFTSTPISETITTLHDQIITGSLLIKSYVQ